MNRYRLGPKALHDVDEIYAYIAKANRSAADRLFEKLESTFRLLGSERFMGQRCEDISADLRSFSVGNYVIYFRPNDAGVDIVRILHGARDAKSLLE